MHVTKQTVFASVLHIQTTKHQVLGPSQTGLATTLFATKWVAQRGSGRVFQAQVLAGHGCKVAKTATCNQTTLKYFALRLRELASDIVGK